MTLYSPSEPLSKPTDKEIAKWALEKHWYRRDAIRRIAALNSHSCDTNDVRTEVLNLTAAFDQASDRVLIEKNEWLLSCINNGYDVPEQLLIELPEPAPNPSDGMLLHIVSALSELEKEASDRWDKGDTRGADAVRRCINKIHTQINRGARCVAEPTKSKKDQGLHARTEQGYQKTIGLLSKLIADMSNGDLGTRASPNANQIAEQVQEYLPVDGLGQLDSSGVTPESIRKRIAAGVKLIDT